MRRVIFIVAVVLLLRPVLAVAAEHWYDDHERGWFWYEIEPEPPPKEKPPKPPPAPSSVPNPPKPLGGR